MSKQTLWIIRFLTVLAFGFTKLSVVFLYKRIFWVDKTFQIIVRWVNFVVCLWTVAFFFTNLSMNS